MKSVPRADGEPGTQLPLTLAQAGTEGFLSPQT